MDNKTGIKGNFSVALGLFDYINPIFYSITMITFITHLRSSMIKGVFLMFLAGALISLTFGLAIPTVKLIVGLGKMQFKMPVNLVSYVNTGILLTGIALSSHVLGISFCGFVCILVISAAIICLLWKKTGKFNTVAVLIGAVGYIFIYISLICLAVRKCIYLPILFYVLAICMFVMLILIGIKSDLKNSRVHWAIEICNVTCQGLVALGTLILFA